MKTTLTNLLKVKSLTTLAIIGTLCAMTILGQVESEVFCTIAGSVVTYYFTRKGDEGKDV